MSVSTSRTAELAANLADVRARIERACAAADRPATDVTLVAVTKTFPVGDVRTLVELGASDIGENRDAEAAPKAAELAAAGLAVRWHFIGQLQRNKCRSVVRYADLVHSVDRLPLVRALATAVDNHRRRPLDVLVQLSLDGATGRGGVPSVELPELVAAIQETPQLRLRGLMAVAPRTADTAGAFRSLAEHFHWLRESVPGADILSAGMTGDFEQAIRSGATHVRVGSALLGGRVKLG